MIEAFNAMLDWLRTVTPDEVKAYYWAASEIYLTPWFWGFTLSILFFEWLRPGVPTQRVFSWGLAQDFVWFNADIVLRVALLPAYVGVLSLLYKSLTGGFTFTAMVPVPLPVKIVAAVVIFDFLQWGNHWIRHKVRPFWHFHSIHHSQRELNTFTDLRIHSGEYFIAETIAFMPMLALGVPALAVMGVGGFRMWYARFVHANIGMNFGPLKHVFVTPQYHRIHHSIEPRHQDKNFGVILTVWDRIFGTLNRNYDEYPATGVIGLEFEPPRRLAPTAWLRDFFRMFLHPFRALRTPDTRKVTPGVPREGVALSSDAREVSGATKSSRGPAGAEAIS
jgi:sterol desaturase/sphingolipid hydroxylase (fatty acid hydroxylase superfamily)